MEKYPKKKWSNKAICCLLSYQRNFDDLAEKYSLNYKMRKKPQLNIVLITKQEKDMTWLVFHFFFPSFWLWGSDHKLEHDIHMILHCLIVSPLSRLFIYWEIRKISSSYTSNNLALEQKTNINHLIRSIILFFFWFS